MKVYEPREDSFLILRHIKKYSKGKVLDMGTGSGILAIEAAKYADRVIAVDINRQALKAAEKNASEQKTSNIEFQYSDLFSNIKGTFDLIIFNPPYLPSEKEQDPSLDGGKKGYETIELFLNQVHEFLNQNGKILLLFSSLTKKTKVEEISTNNLFSLKLLDKQRIFFETLYVYLLEKSPILKKLNHVKKLSLYAKGKRGLVYTGIYKGKKVAVKIENPKSKAVGRIEIEGLFLGIVNKAGIGPKLIEAETDFIIMEFIGGDRILDYFQKSSKQKIRKCIEQIFDQLYTLDKMGINKEEMHHPIKHIIVVKDRAVLIDFERAAKREKTHNVTQFCQFLTNKKVSIILSEKEIVVNRKKIINAAKEYSKNQTKTKLNKILKIL